MYRPTASNGMPPAETLTDTTALTKPTRPPPTAEDVMRLAGWAMKAAKLGRIQHADRDDIHSELCVFGLRQLQTFNPALGSFSTHFIRWAILRAQHLRREIIKRFDSAGVRTLNHDAQRDSYSHDPVFGVEDSGLAGVDIADEAAGAEAVMLAALNERERAVFVARVVDDITLNEIAIRLGITKERVRQIEITATMKIRKAVGNG